MNKQDRYDSLFDWYGSLHGVNWLKIKAQAIIESDLNPDAINPVSKAKGLMQFMDATFLEWQDNTPGVQELINKFRLINPLDPEDAIDHGSAYMAWLLKQTSQNWDNAWICYNWGIGNWKRAMQQYGPAWQDHLPEETRNYVARIRAKLQFMGG